MAAPAGDIFTIYLDSGDASAVVYLPDSTGTPTYANFSVNLAVPLKLTDSQNWFCTLAECVYQTPTSVDSSVLVYVDCVNSTQINNISTQLLARILAPAFPSSTYTVQHYPAGSWPVPFTQSSTVIPWCQVSSASLARIQVTFRDSSGTIIAAPIPGHGVGNSFNIAITFKYFGPKSFTSILGS